MGLQALPPIRACMHQSACSSRAKSASCNLLISATIVLKQQSGMSFHCASSCKQIVCDCCWLLQEGIKCCCLCSGLVCSIKHWEQTPISVNSSLKSSGLHMNDHVGDLHSLCPATDLSFRKYCFTWRVGLSGEGNLVGGLCVLCVNLAGDFFSIRREHCFWEATDEWSCICG